MYKYLVLFYSIYFLTFKSNFAKFLPFESLLVRFSKLWRDGEVDCLGGLDRVSAALELSTFLLILSDCAGSLLSVVFPAIFAKGK